MGQIHSGNVVFDFSDCRFVVTGASSGIGKCVATELAASGADVLIIARREKELRSVQELFPKRIYVATIDVTDSSALRSSIDEFSQLGLISGSVHAAGINKFTPIRNFNKADAEKIMDVSLWAGIELVKILSRKKYRAKCSSHVLLSSVNGVRVQKGLMGYCATKSAILNAVRTMALELSPMGIRVNSVSPGLVDTGMAKQMAEMYPAGIQTIQEQHPLGVGTVTDIANMVLFLLSDRTRWVTGSNVVVDGGFLA